MLLTLLLSTSALALGAMVATPQSDDDIEGPDATTPPLEPTSETGTGGSDILHGTIEDNVMRGYGGDDLMQAFAGHDLVFGGDGDDQIYGEEGDDTLRGGTGNDWLFGGEDNDYLLGKDGNDNLSGGTGTDLLKGGRGDDVLDGTDGAEDATDSDTLEAGDGNDRLFGDNGDLLSGGEGVDSFEVIVDPNSDSMVHIRDFDMTAVDGDAVETITLLDQNGDQIPLEDLLQLDAPMLTIVDAEDGTGALLQFNDVNVALVEGVSAADLLDTTNSWLGNTIVPTPDPIYGTGGADELTGNQGDDAIRAYGGDDLVDGNGGDDRVLAGSGDDTVFGGTGNDVLRGMNGNDSLVGEEGNDYLVGKSGDDTLLAGTGTDVLTGGIGSDLLDGRDGAVSGTDSDTLVGGDDSDRLIGDNGDVLTGGNGLDDFDVVVDADDAAVVQITDFDPMARDGDDAETITLLDENGQPMPASDFNNPDTTALSILDAEDGSGAILHLNGVDVAFVSGVSASELQDNLDSWLGNLAVPSVEPTHGTGAGDTLAGTADAEVIRAYGGDDTVDAAGGDDLVFAGDGDDSVSGGDGADTLRGGNGSDLLEGGDGDDYLLGKFGDDTLEAGEGTDLLKGGSGDDLLNGQDNAEDAADSDTLIGGDGGDQLIGDNGDVLEGGEGYNTFEVVLHADAGAMVHIRDFEPTTQYGQDKDVITFVDDNGDPMPVDMFSSPFIRLVDDADGNGVFVQVNGITSLFLEGVTAQQLEGLNNRWVGNYAS